MIALPTHRAPTAILALLLALWVGCGIWIAGHAPFGSGTDESIKYLAFAAAKNRWATEADFHRYGIEHYYYPPLYFLSFAPFWGDEPSFVEGYPEVGAADIDPNYASLAGRRMMSTNYAARVPPSLDRLYRQAKLFSLGLGLVCLLSLVATLRLLFPGPAGWWVVLLGSAPLLFLPQFLYYHTLVNNDTLLNALSALATLGFTAAVLALERGQRRRFLALSSVVGACIGLALLTKLSAPVLVPLAFGLVWARFIGDRGRGWRERAGRALALLTILSVVIFASGGWWIGYKAWLGDWNSFEAARLAHPWGAVNPVWLSDPSWWTDRVLQILRSYYALFSGALFIGVPDVVFLAWLIVPGAVLVCAAALAAARFAGAGHSRPVGPGSGLRHVIDWTLAGVVLLNAGTILWTLRSFRAAYGRLLFPSLIAMHVIAAGVIARALRGRQRALAAAALLVVAYTGLLFFWTFRHRMVSAVTQPPEHVRVLNGVGTSLVAVRSVWEFAADQQLTIPAGNLAALRINLWRNLVPQLGAALEGTLELKMPDGTQPVIRLRRTALGDHDLCEAWPEIELERPVRLATATTALLCLRGTPPSWQPWPGTFAYRCSNGGTPSRWDGVLNTCALCVAAVYRPETSGGAQGPGETAAQSLPPSTTARSARQLARMSSRDLILSRRRSR